MDEQIRASFESALADIEKKNSDLRKLEVDASLYGYTISTNVPYGGDCFFGRLHIIFAKIVNLKVRYRHRN